jgi:hypothetical protein
MDTSGRPILHSCYTIAMNTAWRPTIQPAAHVRTMQAYYTISCVTENNAGLLYNQLRMWEQCRPNIQPAAELKTMQAYYTTSCARENNAGLLYNQLRNWKQCRPTIQPAAHVKTKQAYYTTSCARETNAGLLYHQLRTWNQCRPTIQPAAHVITMQPIHNAVAVTDNGPFIQTIDVKYMMCPNVCGGNLHTIKITLNSDFYQFIFQYAQIS